MALQKTVITPFGFTAVDAYHRVENVVLDGKARICFQICSYRTSEDTMPFDRTVQACAYDLHGANPYAQAYVYTKQLPEFVDANNVFHDAAGNAIITLGSEPDPADVVAATLTGNPNNNPQIRNPEPAPESADGKWVWSANAVPTAAKPAPASGIVYTVNSDGGESSDAGVINITDETPIAPLPAPEGVPTPASDEDMGPIEGTPPVASTSAPTVVYPPRAATITRTPQPGDESAHASSRNDNQSSDDDKPAPVYTEAFPSPDQAMIDGYAKRDALLQESSEHQQALAPMTESMQQEYAVYDECLGNVVNQSGFPAEAEWPKEPQQEYTDPVWPEVRPSTPPTPTDKPASEQTTEAVP